MPRVGFFRWPWALVVAAVFTLAVIAGNVLWISADQSPPPWDMAGHSARAMLMEDYLSAGKIASIITHATIYPPFVTVWTGVVFWVAGRQEDVPQLSLLIFVLITGAATFGIAKKLFQSDGLAGWAVVIVLTVPLAAHFSRLYDLDYPLMALVAATLFCLLQTNGFRHRGWSIMFGIVVAAGMLTKWTMFIFVLGPVGLNVLDRSDQKKRWTNFAVAIGIAAILIGPWYSFHTKSILRSAAATRENVFSVPTQQLFSAESIGYYWHKTVSGMTWPMAILGAAGLILCAIRRKREHWFLLSWAILPYVIMTFGFYSKESRYVLPLFPALAISGAYALWSIGNQSIRRGAWLLLGAWGVGMWFQSSWGGLIPESIQRTWGIGSSYGFTGVGGYGYTWPTNYGGAIRKIAPAIQADLKSRGWHPASVDVGVVPNSIFLNDDNMRYYGLLADVPIRTGISNRLRGAEWPKAILEVDYLVTKTGDQGPKVFQGRVGEIVVEEKNLDSQIFKQFELIGRWPVKNPEFGYPEMRVYRNLTRRSAPPSP